MISLLIGICVGCTLVFTAGGLLFSYFIKDDIETRKRYINEMVELRSDYYS